MNYLAHFHLAGNNEGLIVGAFLGDFIKGPLTINPPSQLNSPAPLSADTVRGIQLHRRIDHYVDHLPQLVALGNELPKPARRFKGIFLDLYCDCALINHWQQVHSVSLTEFTSNILTVLEQHRHCFPATAEKLYSRMVQYNLLSNYNNRDVMDAILDRIGRRLNKVEELKQGQQAMWELKSQWDKSFLDNYSQIVQFANNEKQKLGNNRADSLTANG